jgi:hypothetical protein
MGRKLLEDGGGDQRGTHADGVTPLKDWIELYKVRLKADLTAGYRQLYEDSVKYMSEYDWAATRALMEEFPEPEDRAEIGRREIVVQLFLKRQPRVERGDQTYDARFTLGAKLSALRDDRAQHPEKYEGKDQHDLRDLPWRVAFRGADVWRQLK